MKSGCGKVAVEVLYPKKTKDSGTVVPSAGWGLWPVLKFSTGQFKGATSIQIRFTAGRGRSFWALPLSGHAPGHSDPPGG